MKTVKRITALVLCVILTFTALAGCSKSDIIDFIYPFEGNIRSFDPQVASTADEFLIAENCYEGLVRVLDDGTVQAGVAEKWSISDDGLTYIFHLRKGAKWNVQSDNLEKPTKAQELMGTDFNPDITAKDFVFALKRAVDPITDAPLFSTVSNIVNASKIHSKKAKVNTLGVKAIDDYTLEIKLNSADDSFLTTLSTAVAMPCNEDYFYATKGRYGLGLDYSIFNGQFCVTSILESSYILDNNEFYIGEYPSAVSNITLNIVDDNAEIPKKLKSGYYDCAYITGAEYESLNDNSITVKPYSNKMWAFVLNKNKMLFGNKKLREAVCLGTSDISLDEHTYLSKATTFTPPSCNIGKTPANEALGVTVVSHDIEKAKDVWKQGLEETGITKADIDVIVPEGMEDIAKELVQGIQGSIGQISSYGKNNKISFSLKLTVLNDDDFDKAFAGGEYDIALYKFEATGNSCSAFLKQIIKGNYAGEIDGIDNALKEAQNTSSANEIKACKKCEKELMNDYSIMPVMFESSYYAQAKGVSGVQFHAGSGRVSFVNATREN